MTIVTGNPLAWEHVKVKIGNENLKINLRLDKH